MIPGGRYSGWFSTDGTLVGTRSIAHHLFEEPRNCDDFYTFGEFCPPNKPLLAMAEGLYERGYEVVIVTGRDGAWIGQNPGSPSTSPSTPDCSCGGKVIGVPGMS